MDRGTPDRFVCESGVFEWNLLNDWPQASTRVNSSSGPGSGICRSAIFKWPPCLESWTTFIPHCQLGSACPQCSATSTRPARADGPMSNRSGFGRYSDESTRSVGQNPIQRAKATV